MLPAAGLNGEVGAGVSLGVGSRLAGANGEARFPGTHTHHTILAVRLWVCQSTSLSLGIICVWKNTILRWDEGC